MAHLRIEQNNILENVSSAVIEKLYLLAISGDLDASSNLAGNIHTTATYLDYIDALHTAYPDLTITATTTYMMIEDPEVLTKLKGYVGDGTGVTTVGCLGLTTLNGYYSKLVNGLWTNIDLFNLNQNLIKFNELASAINCTTIGNSAFLLCTNLEEINISNITTLGHYAFYGDSKCTFTGSGLSNIQHMNSGGYLFTACSKITGVLNLSNYLDTLVPANAFERCTGITSVIIPTTVTSIGNYCFQGCSSLTSVTLPNTCTTLERGAFAACTNLTSIDTSNVTGMSYLCFDLCTNLTSLDFSNVTGFYKAVGSTHVTRGVFPKMTTISNSAFEYSPFVYLEFGENLTSIGIQAFWGSTGLRTLVFRSTTPPSFDTTNSNRFLYDMSNLTVYVPDASVNDYKTAWSGMTNQITGISNLPQS